MTTSPPDAAAHGATSAGLLDLRAREAEPSLGTLVSEATKELSSLVSTHIELAKAELRNDVKAAAVGGGMFGVAAVLGVLATILLSFALAWGLVELGLEEWAAFLIVGGTYLLIAGLIAFLGMRTLKKVEPPVETQRSVKGTVAALKGTVPTRH